MPEVISKYPEITLKVLKEAGARCGPEFQPRILTKCPPERFCLFPSGEICVYGIDEISKMTQISQSELIQGAYEKVQPIKIVKEPLSFGLLEVIFFVIVGIVLGVMITKKFFRTQTKT